jgi:HKD family nuclease
MLPQNTLLTNTNIKLLTVFIMESGVRLILDDLILALNNGAQIQILIGYYLGITEPSALYLLRMSLNETVDMRVFKHKGISFHPKLTFSKTKTMAKSILVCLIFLSAVF